MQKSDKNPNVERHLATYSLIRIGLAQTHAKLHEAQKAAKNPKNLTYFLNPLHSYFLLLTAQFTTMFHLVLTFSLRK